MTCANKKLFKCFLVKILLTLIIVYLSVYWINCLYLFVRLLLKNNALAHQMHRSIHMSHYLAHTPRSKILLQVSHVHGSVFLVVMSHGPWFYLLLLWLIMLFSPFYFTAITHYKSITDAMFNTSWPFVTVSSMTYFSLFSSWIKF